MSDRLIARALDMAKALDDGGADPFEAASIIRSLVERCAPRLTRAETTVMLELHDRGVATYNGRARRQIAALERLGLVVAKWGFQSHTHGQGYRHTEEIEVRLTDAGLHFMKDRVPNG